MDSFLFRKYNSRKKGGITLMKLIIDNADIEAIKKVYEYYPVDGVTTNPSILAATGRPPYEVLHEIRSFIGQDELHVQVISGEADSIIKEAHRIVSELGPHTFVKIPCLPEGFKAMKELVKEGVLLTGTAVYTPLQALLAAKCGVNYVAPYINRIDNMGYDGIAVEKHIHDILKNNDFKTEVLAASFKNSQQLLDLCEYGIGAATVAPDVIMGLVRNPAITAAVDDFRRDFENLTDKGMTMYNC